LYGESEKCLLCGILAARSLAYHIYDVVGFKRSSGESRMSFWRKLKDPATREHQLLLRLVDIPGDVGILSEFLNPRRSGEGAIVYGNMIAHGQSLALAAKFFHGTPIMPLINICG
jgi:hypothetical protein